VEWLVSQLFEKVLADLQGDVDSTSHLTSSYYSKEDIKLKTHIFSCFLNLQHPSAREMTSNV